MEAWYTRLLRLAEPVVGYILFRVVGVAKETLYTVEFCKRMYRILGREGGRERKGGRSLKIKLCNVYTLFYSDKIITESTFFLLDLIDCNYLLTVDRCSWPGHGKPSSLLGVSSLLN